RLLEGILGVDDGLEERGVVLGRLREAPVDLLGGGRGRRGPGRRPAVGTGGAGHVAPPRPLGSSLSRWAGGAADPGAGARPGAGPGGVAAGRSSGESRVLISEKGGARHYSKSGVAPSRAAQSDGRSGGRLPRRSAAC